MPLPVQNLDAWSARYVESLGVRGLSPRTLTTAENALSLFARWCGERGVVEPREVSRAVVERYQRWLYHVRKTNGQPLAVGTQYSRLVYVRGLFGWLARQRVLLYNPASELELPKRSQRLPVDSLSIAEVEAVLAIPDLETLAGVRDRAILETFYSTGMRRTELIDLDLWDFDRERGCVTIRRGKGGKARVVPIGERARRWVERYLEEVRLELVIDPDERALFVSDPGRRFLQDGMSRRVKRYLAAAGITKPGSCHLFRHACATLMLEGGADIRYIQEMLGHARLDTTQLYTRVSIEKLKAIHAATHPARLERTETVAQELAGGDDEDH